jgi:GNAT superfamily N-acetyltransferase
MGEERDLVASRFARGCRCFAVLVDESVGGYGWFSTGREWIGELQLEITLPAGEGYIWNCATVLEHRRKGIFRSLLVGISEAARREGFRRLWIGSVAIPAEKAVGPSGFRPALRFTAIAPPGAHVMRVHPATGAELSSDAYSVLSIKPGLHVRKRRSRRH